MLLDSATEVEPTDAAGASQRSLQPISPAEPSGITDHRSLRLLHRDLDLAATCFRIANESRRLLRCDRVTVLVPRGRSHEVVAVSGVAIIDKRSNAISTIEKLVYAVVVMSRPLLLPSAVPMPPQIEDPLERYRDETGVASAFVMPLHSPQHVDDGESDESADFDPFDGNGDCVGVIILEYFSGDAPREVNLPTTIVAGEAALALRNSLEHRRVFGLKLWKSVGNFVDRRRLPWVALSGAVACGLIVASMLVKVDHYVVAKGTAEPTLRREVFATIDGIVKTVHVLDGQIVKKSEPLFDLENAELDSREEGLSGEIQTATQRLASVKAVRLSGDSDPSQSSRLAIELRQVESELTSLRGQLAVLQSQKKELIVTSPIDGFVVGWQMERRLTDRPFARGNVLASIVEPTGPWSLRLQISDRDAGEIISAANLGEAVPIEFAIATLPESSFAASLDHIATASRMDETGQYVIDADGTISLDAANKAGFDTFDIASMRSGADVTAKIACGKRTILKSGSHAA